MKYIAMILMMTVSMSIAQEVGSETAEREALAAKLAREADPVLMAEWQAAKSPELKQTENNFVLLCRSLGLPDHATLPEVEATLTALVESDPSVGIPATLKMFGINQAGIRYGGVLWRDDAAWHQEIAQ